jgi:plastocyanin
MHRRIALIPALLAAGIATAVVAQAAGAGQAATPMKVTVTATDFKFKLSKTSVPSGRPIVFTLINRGPSPHDFDFSGMKGTPVILRGRQATLRITFKKAGSARYLCTVPRHAQFGMVGRLKVT